KQPGEAIEERHENQGERNIECRMKARDQLSRREIQSRKQVRDRLEKGQHEGAADDAVDHITEGEPPARRVGWVPCRDEGVYRTPEIGANDKGEGSHRANEV